MRVILYVYSTVLGCCSKMWLHGWGPLRDTIPIATARSAVGDSHAPQPDPRAVASYGKLLPAQRVVDLGISVYCTWVDGGEWRSWKREKEWKERERETEEGLCFEQQQLPPLRSDKWERALFHVKKGMLASSTSTHPYLPIVGT